MDATNVISIPDSASVDNIVMISDSADTLGSSYGKVINTGNVPGFWTSTGTTSDGAVWTSRPAGERSWSDAPEDRSVFSTSIPVKNFNRAANLMKDCYDNMILEVLAAGYDKEDLSVQLADHSVVIEFRKHEEDGDSLIGNNYEYLIHDITSVEETISQHFDAEYDVRAATASLDKGILTILIPPKTRSNVEIVNKGVKTRVSTDAQP
jgi:HSP20 family molecular chaperone IbpA